jgi:outer membrane protein TolC
MNPKSLLLKRLLAPLRAWVVTATLAATLSVAAQDQIQNTLPPSALPEAPAGLTPLPRVDEPPALPPVGLPANANPGLPPAAINPIQPAAPAAPAAPALLDAPQPAAPAILEPGQSLPAAIAPSAAPEAVPAPAAAPVAPLDLHGCIQLGLSRQPAIRAAQASLSAAIASKNGLDNIRFGRLLAPDLPIRRQQACIGINIASAGVVHAEWEARYAITRTYFSVQYARMQKKEVDNILVKLDLAHKRAKELVDIGDPKIPVTKIDVDVIALNIKMVQTRQAEAAVGIEKAYAGLREAIGLGCDEPFEIIEEPLPALVHDFDRQKLIALALANRAEIQQAQDAQGLTSLEIAAQKKYLFRPLAATFASGADIHAKPIPQGRSNGTYEPSATGPEMPVTLAGPRRDRVDRAGAFDDRAGAVVDKTHNLISLEADFTYLKWKEAYQKVVALDKTDKEASRIYNTIKERFDTGKGSGEELLRARTLEDQSRISYNEALFQHALALAALERVTAGGYSIYPASSAAAAPKK